MRRTVIAIGISVTAAAIVGWYVWRGESAPARSAAGEAADNGVVRRAQRPPSLPPTRDDTGVRPLARTLSPRVWGDWQALRYSGTAIAAVGTGDPLAGRQAPWRSRTTDDGFTLEVWPDQGIYGREALMTLSATLVGTQGSVQTDAKLSVFVIARSFVDGIRGDRIERRSVGTMKWNRYAARYELRFPVFETSDHHERVVLSLIVAATVPTEAGTMMSITAQAQAEVQVTPTVVLDPEARVDWHDDSLEIALEDLPRDSSLTWAIGVVSPEGLDRPGVLAWCVVEDGNCRLRIPRASLKDIPAEAGAHLRALRVYSEAQDPAQLLGYHRGTVISVPPPDATGSP